MIGSMNFASAQSGYCMNFAAAGTFAREFELLGTALLAVSILLVRLVLKA